MELKVTTDKVLAAAKQCPDAKRTLETLFPEAFEKQPLVMLHSASSCGFSVMTNSGSVVPLTVITVRAGGKYTGKGLYLGKGPTWEIHTDESGQEVLIALPK